MVIKNQAANTAFAGVSVLIGLIFAVVAFAPGGHTHPPSAGSRVGSGLAVVMFATMACRALQMGVVVGPHAITLRSFGSTKVVGWDQVRDLTIVDSGNITGRATCVALVLTSGEVVRAMGAASFKAAKVQTMLTRLEGAWPVRAA